MSTLTWTGSQGYIDTGAISGVLAIKPQFTFVYDSLYYEPTDNNTFYIVGNQTTQLTEATILEIVKYMTTFTGGDLQVQGVDATGKYLGFVAKSVATAVVGFAPPKGSGFYRYDLTSKTYVRIYGVDNAGNYLGNVELGTYFEDAGSPPPRTDITMVWNFVTKTWDDTRPASVIAAEVITNTRNSYEQLVTDYLNQTAKSRGYDDIVSMCSYAGAPNKYQAEAIAFLTWRSDVWDYCPKLFNDVAAGTVSLPAFDVVKTALPPIPTITTP